LPFRVNIQEADDALQSERTGARRGRPRIRRDAAHGPTRPGRLRPRHRWYVLAKTVFEFALAATLLVVSLPVILAAAALVKLTSRGPAFYTQVRLGRSGKPFTMYKLRTMVDKCESLTGPRWAIPGDPRITWVGNYLRKAHLDELPQLLNVVRGEMGLIGPRPERPEFFPELERALPRYRERLAVLPGVTGLAQVLLPADADVSGVRRKLAYDLYYVEHVSLPLDLRIVVCTALYAAGAPFRVTRRLLGRAGSEQLVDAEPAWAEGNEPARGRQSA
jgi:lipopolysaccharide/colanic/teichoic acid biosynthesis glycosyltransferase